MYMHGTDRLSYLTPPLSPQVDNLIHSDLHPGNILVRLNPPKGLMGIVYGMMDLAKGLGKVGKR